MMIKQVISSLGLFLLIQGFTTPLWSGSISGIIKSDKGRLVKNARIKAWDNDPTSKDDLLGTATTNNKGRYRIIYSEKHWDGAEIGPTLKSSSPDIYITVEIKVRGQWEHIGKSRIYKNHDIDKPLLIDMLNVDRTNAYVRRTVYGIITNKKGLPISGIMVKAWDKDWGNKLELMGSAKTNQKGQYRISYADRRWDGFNSGPSLGKVSNPDIFITVLSKKNSRQIGKSAVFKDHPLQKRLKINLKIK